MKIHQTSLTIIFAISLFVTPDLFAQPACPYQQIWSIGSITAYSKKNCNMQGSGETCACNTSGSIVGTGIYPQAVQLGCTCNDNGSACRCQTLVPEIGNEGGEDYGIYPVHWADRNSLTGSATRQLGFFINDDEEGGEGIRAYICFRFSQNGLYKYMAIQVDGKLEPNQFCRRSGYTIDNNSGDPFCFGSSIRNEATELVDVNGELFLRVTFATGTRDYLVLGSNQP